MVLPFWRVCTLKNREKLKLLKLVALIWQLRWGRMVVVVMRVCWNKMFSGGKNMNLCVGACVLCLYSERTLKQPRWLKAETAEVAESHIYGASSTHTRQIWSNVRFTRGPPIAKPIFFIHAQKPTVQLFLSSSQHERLKKTQTLYNYGFQRAVWSAVVRCQTGSLHISPTEQMHPCVATSLRPLWKVRSDKRQT